MKLTIFVILVLSFTSISRQVKAMEADSLVMRGLNLTFAMRFDEAINEFEKVIARDTTHPGGYFMKSAVYFWKFTRNYRSQKIGDEFETASLHAVEKAEKYLDEHENDQDGMFYLGGIYGNLGRYYAIKRNYWKAYWNGKSGKNYLEDLVEINPEYYDAYLGLGIYHYYAAVMPKFLKFFSFILGIDGEKEQGLQELQLAIDKGTFTSNEARIFLSAIYLRIEHEYEKALTLIQELVEQYPQNQAFQVSLGWAHTRLNDDDQALKVFDKVLQNRDPDFQLVINQALYYSGDIYFKYNKFDQAITNYEQVVEYSADIEENRHWIYARCLLSLGKTYEMKGDRQSAIKYYGQINEEYSEWSYKEAEDRLKNPLTPVDIKLILARNYCNAAQFDTAFVLFEELLTETYGRTDDETRLIKAKVYQHRGRVYRDLQKYDQSLNDLQNVFELLEDEPDWLIEWNHYYLGQVYESIGQYEMAEEHYEEAMETDSFRLKNRTDAALSKLKKRMENPD